ncbi:YY1-associated protein 1 [Monodelphis domestica]|uniref:YY1-associated protein 1 n=1 Tax=Monodelphis domestica TaxID=13616 RepID=UPI0004431AFD|nr:YY1-associated protein 1 [Monodelphis domestica]
MSKPQTDNDMQTWVLNAAQRKRLQQQMQQHVQLLTQIHLLASTNSSLSSEASTTKMFLKELGTFAQSSVVLHHQYNPKFQTTFQPCNLKGALQLIEDFHSHINIDLSPRKNVKESATEFPCMPKQVAWILATSKVFMYPELLPIRSLKVKNPRDKIFFTKAEDNLLALGLKHFEGTEFPKPLISKYLLTAKSAHQLTVRIKNLNNSRAPDNIIKYYKKTKQLPILFKCCEDLQPDQWKPPVEREERHLPFWLKASLPSIQEEIQHLANDAGESRNMAGFAETSSEPGLESKNGSQYPLLLPKGVVLTLKPLAKRFSSRRIWRQRSSVLKPLLIRPAPSLQPCSSDSTGVRVARSEAPSSKVENSNSQLIQPATVLHTRVPEASPSAVTGGDGIPLALPAIAPENGTPTPVLSQSFLSPTPATFLSPVTPKLGVSGVKPPKRKWAKASRLLKPSPVLPSPSVILTVPGTVIQPLTAVAQSPQTIPITALLLSPTSFICPLNQPLIASSLPSLIVSGNPVSLPVPPIPEDNTQVKTNIPHPQAEGESAFPAIEPKTEPQESSSLCPCPYPKEEHSPGPPTSGRERRVDSFEGNTHSWTVVKTLDGRQVLEPLCHASQKTFDFLQGNLLNIVKVEPEEPGEEASSSWSRFPEPGICDEIKKDVLMELDVESPCEEAGGAPEVKEEAVLEKQAGGETAMTQGKGSLPGNMSKEPPESTASATNPGTMLSSLLTKPEESSSVGGLSVGTPAGPETGGEKDGPEEEEEDLDNPDQDEEMASVSEESVHSGPELQETEKLTCLVSGRCMGPERDSEEDKPQKENSGPERVVKVEEMKSPKKEDEVMAEAGRDPSFYIHFT